MTLRHLGLRALSIVIAVSLVGFVLLAATYERNPLASLDRKTAEWVAASMPSWAEWLARPPSWLGGWIGITAIGIALGVVLVRERAWVDLGFLRHLWRLADRRRAAQNMV